MFTEKFYEVLNHEGVVSIVSWTKEEANVTNTWNSYLVIADENRILIPAAGLKSTQEDLKINNQVKVTLGSKDVEGYNNYQGTGFKLTGTAKFIDSGDDFEMMFEKYPFIRAALEITVEEAKQLL